MADESPRPGIRVLDLSTPRPPGEAPPEPAPEPPAPAVPRGPAPVVGQTLDLSTGKPPSQTLSSRTHNPAGLRVVVQKTINLSTPKAEKAEAPAEPRSRRGTRPDGAPRSRDGQGQDALRTGGGPKGGGRSQGGRRGGPKGGRPRDGGSRGGGPSGQAPRSASSGLADFLDPETLKKLRGE